MLERPRVVQSGGRFSHMFTFHLYSLISLCIYSRGREVETASGWENLHVGAVSRHISRLDSLNTSNDLFKKKLKKGRCAVTPIIARQVP